MPAAESPSGSRNFGAGWIEEQLAIRIIAEATVEAVKKSIEDWVRLLAAEKYSEASDFLWHEEDYPWPPEMLKKIVTGYREFAKVTDPDHSFGGLEPRHEVRLSSIDPNYLGEAWYDMPILGKWCDLTATFFVKKQVEGAVLILQDFRVM